MKIALKIISIILILNACNSTKKLIITNSPKQIKKELVGSWDFEILHDENGNKIDTIWHSFGQEIPEGPLITLNEDGTYTEQFTPENIDSGKWYFDEENQTIVYLLYYYKPYNFAAQELIKRGHAKQDENGDYFEKITRKVFKYSESKLTLLERGNRRRTFKKKNE